MFNINKILNRLDLMIENAINGNSIENIFDESKLSRLESKFHKYLLKTKMQEEKIKQEKHEVNQLISDISHQTKTPISNIMLYSELLMEGQIDDKLKNYNQLIIDETEKLNFLITELVKVSRIEEGIISPNVTLQNLSTLFQKLKLSYPNIKIKETNTKAYFDLKWTIEAVSNIIDNAYKYGSSQVTVKSDKFEMFCKIDIIDNGTGIDSSEYSKIFTRFYRCEKVYEKKGLGLGLYISREIISKQGGYIKVNSKVNKGSVFSIYLPL